MKNEDILTNEDVVIDIEYCQKLYISINCGAMNPWLT
jgi:hypothetical protein